jgi:phage terminase large subunit GpA-like protein
MLSDHYYRATADVTAAHSAFKPPRRVPVSQGAAEALFIKQPGGVPMLWSPEETPYMVEPMDLLASRRHEAVVFVGPARTGKTAGLLLGWMAHAVTNDPGDMLFVQMTQDKAREFSKTDVDRAIRHSPDILEMMGSSQDDNTHDKMFRHGMWLRIAWPTVSNVSGSTYRYVAITDYDRIANAENVDGEGPLFQLALKRTQTFMSRGMCLAESSPGIEIADPHWRPATAHEAPPVTGIGGIYNRSDRRRRYWKCPDCSNWFEASPGLKLFGLPSEDVLLEIVREADLEAIANEHNRIVCPHCSAKMGPRSKRVLDSRGKWLADGLILTKQDEIVGRAHESTIAGYWLGGVAASYQSWRSIILRYLQGLRDYVLTGSEETLKTTTNTDQGAFYLPRHLAEAAKSSLDPAARRDESLQRYVVPDQTRVLIATVDVQGGASPYFVVQVYAIGPFREKWIVDRYNISESARPGIGDGKAPLDPAAYAEDWDLLTEKVVRSTYRTSDDQIEMRVRMTVVDSGGEDGVTDRAYAWYRRVRKQGYASRVMLTKGVGKDWLTTTAPIRESLVGGKKGAEGDIPLFNFNSNYFKDVVWAGIRRPAPGPGYFHIPKWLPQAFLDEVFHSEVRDERGRWNQVRKRNEGLDGIVMCEVACVRMGLDKINWEFAPIWARPLAENSEIVSKAERREMQANESLPTEDGSPRQEQAAPVRRISRRSSRSSRLS